MQAQAFTHDSYLTASIVAGFPSGLVALEHEGIRLTQSPVGLAVAGLRRDIVDEPLIADVADEASQTLRTELGRWLGPFTERLPSWRQAGYDHLVVWPHGPLHYLPWHLFSATDSGPPLADSWTVTVLATLGSMLRAPAAPGSSLVAVGCADGGQPYGLPSAPTMPTQAAAVAAAFGVEPLRNATPREVLDALPGARYLHIASHGSHVEEAPAFQCMYLTPDTDGEGRLFAYELAGADLSGVELVTLSACETALGRFDVSDNLRGIPAALLAAGASAVVGAMWPVGPDAATTFFTSLYAALARGRTRLEAFRDAQVETRRLHPRYYDWGAMTYIGDWR